METDSLQIEHKMLNHLKGVMGIPKVYWFGQEGGYNILILQKLGQNIDELNKKSDTRGEFSLMTLLLVIDKMLDRIRAMHEKDIIHRDIKPENFLIYENL